MSTIKYNKLIRDNIPSIIEASGKQCVVEVMDDQQYAAKLAEKLSEELGEFLAEFKAENDEKAIAELADMAEVILAIVDLIGVSREGFESIRRAKVTTNGAFTKKLLLTEVNTIVDSNCEE